MLNRHVIVLFLGNAAMLLLHPPPSSAVAPIGGWFLLLLVGLLLDTGEPGSRTNVGHALQLAGVVLLVADVAVMAPAGRGVWPQAMAEVGISLAAVGLLVEMRAPYASLRAGVAIQVFGDALYVGAFALALAFRTMTPSTVGWVFIGIAGAVSLYAAISNGILQVSRLVNPQAGWRFRVLGMDADALRLKTPDAETRLEWKYVKGLKRLDARHMLLVLPSPLPAELLKVGLPLEELRQSAEPPAQGTSAPPDAFGFVLHEQEVGQPLDDAERALSAHLVAVGH